MDYTFGPDDATETVYASVGRPLVSLALAGGVGTLFAYGQTCSGKTLTIGGMYPMLARDLFKDKALALDRKFHLSFYELLGTSVMDLLYEKADPEQAAPCLNILEDKFGKVVVKGATEIEVKDVDHFEKLVAQALRHRKTETTFKNDSSR